MWQVILAGLAAIVAAFAGFFKAGQAQGKSEADKLDAEHEAKVMGAVAKELTKDRSADDVVKDWDNRK